MFSKPIGCLGLALMLLAPPDVAAQGRVEGVSRAYDHFYREARNGVGYAQIFRGGGDTPSFEEWQTAKAHMSRGEEGLVSRCEPPVLQARALLVESYTIMERHGGPGDVIIVNEKGAQAARLLDSVADCWQAMVAFERNCLHAFVPASDRRVRARRLIAADEFHLNAEEHNCTTAPRRATPYPSGKLIGNVRDGQPRPAKPSKPSRPAGGPLALNPIQPRSAPLPPLPPNLPPGTIVFDDPFARTCAAGFSTGSIRVTRPQNDGFVHVAGQQQNVITIYVRICNDHEPNDLVEGYVKGPAGRIKTYVYGWGRVLGSPPSVFQFESLRLRDEAGNIVGKYRSPSVAVSLTAAQ
jgi:hypothetical protein